MLPLVFFCFVFLSCSPGHKVHTVLPWHWLDRPGQTTGPQKQQQTPSALCSKETVREARVTTAPWHLLCLFFIPHSFPFTLSGAFSTLLCCSNIENNHMCCFVLVFFPVFIQKNKSFSTIVILETYDSWPNFYYK